LGTQVISSIEADGAVLNRFPSSKPTDGAAFSQKRKLTILDSALAPAS